MTGMTTTTQAVGGEIPFDMVPLTFLRTGQKARVSEVYGSGDLVHRLREMGLRAGAVVEMVRSGSPCIIRLGSQKLCVRADEVTSVLVHTGMMPACP